MYIITFRIAACLAIVNVPGRLCCYYVWLLVTDYHNCSLFQTFSQPGSQFISLTSGQL